MTLTGPGGVGKTRVAIEVAGRELTAFPAGIYFADLTTAANESDVVAALIDGMRLAVPPERTLEAHLAAHLGEEPFLLVVDNCEHVVEEASGVIDRLLTAVPVLRVLATSREPLDLYGEHCVEVPSLEVDGAASAGVRLFTERALAADVDAVFADAERGDDHRDRPSPRRHPARDRARGGADPIAATGGDPRRARRPLPPALARPPSRPGAPVHPRRRGELVLRPARSRRTARVPAPGRLCGIVQPSDRRPAARHQ